MTTYLTCKQFAERSGYAVKTIQRLTRSGEIRSGRRRGAQPGRGVKILIPETELDRFMRPEVIA
ncbi:helix-turn-helix domain-containing protein [Corynebacterium pyruviciproducens]|uniref:helix-turn-helix domain-containing protein n=1 Tax=Corynebacterium pyruviciproducens TaxID=598660 RepID=UPI003C6C5051